MDLKLKNKELEVLEDLGIFDIKIILEDIEGFLLEGYDFLFFSSDYVDNIKDLKIVLDYGILKLNILSKIFKYYNIKNKNLFNYIKEIKNLLNYKNFINLDLENRIKNLEFINNKYFEFINYYNNK